MMVENNVLLCNKYHALECSRQSTFADVVLSAKYNISSYFIN